MTGQQVRDTACYDSDCCTITIECVKYMMMMMMCLSGMIGPRTMLVFAVGLFVLRSARADGIINSMPAFGASSGDPAIMPRFLSRGTTFQVITGENVVLPCEIQNLGTFVVIWRRGSSILSAGRLLVTRDQRFSLQGQHDLQLNAVRVEDQGDYTCQIGDGTPGDLIHTLEILMPPTLQVSPPTGQITARKGGSVTFECKATGNPVPTIHWSKKGGSLPSGLQVENGYLLTLNEVQRQHAGSYQCTATNGIGQPVSADVHLHVLYPPEVSVLRSWVNSGEGLEAKLDCIVHADPPAEVLWYQDSFLLQPTDRRLMSNSGKTHTLTIKNIQLSDFGNYSCVVVNSIGKDKRYIELSGKPGPAIAVSSGYSNPTEYDLRWTVQSVFPIIEVRLLYRQVLINSSYQHPGKWHDIIVRPQQTHFITSTGERTHRYKLTDLVADSVYECLIQSRNQNGWGELSDIHQWFTSQRGHKPPATISMATGAYKHTFMLLVLCVVTIFV